MIAAATVQTAAFFLPATGPGAPRFATDGSAEQRIRTHVVTMTATASGIVGAVVLTALPVDDTVCRAHSAAYRHGDEVLGVHEELAGPTVRAATEQARRSWVTRLAGSGAGRARGKGGSA